ncbi:MAG: hypothetical protein RIR86_412, partial [Acidobacteriota bacterium]
MRLRSTTIVILVTLVCLAVLAAQPLCRSIGGVVAGQTSGPEKPEKAQQKEWRQLFNEKNLEGWDVKIRGYALNDNFGNTFRVEDGLLTVGYEKYDSFNERFGHLFYREKFSHYILAAEYRFIGE